MSNCSGLSIWVGDLDCYINIDAICAENEREAEEAALELELDEIGEIRLLAGKSTSARYLNCNDITPSDWRYAVHQAGMLIGSESVWKIRDERFGVVGFHPWRRGSSP
ncbi:hypothetical protein P7B04_25925, partial [Sphingobium yanoikuyae]|uniref:hypothetical protein n=2 Tax=Sphingobium yanoikuyae TaxID=13690 RepID=UPI00240F6613